MRYLLPAIFVFVSLAFSSSEISAQSLTTTSSSNNGSNGNMFDVSNNGTSSITITGFSQNFMIKALLPVLKCTPAQVVLLLLLQAGA